MKIFALSLLCLASMNAHADAGTELLKQVDDVTQRATVFYQWYILEAADLKNPANNPEIEKYVATSLRKTLKSEEYIDVDYFIKAQDFNEMDWLPNIRVEHVVVDPVCTNVYMSFGLIKKHRVVDCFVKEDGVWKISTVTAITLP